MKFYYWYLVGQLLSVIGIFASAVWVIVSFTGHLVNQNEFNWLSVWAFGLSFLSSGVFSILAFKKVIDGRKREKEAHEFLDKITKL